MRITLWRHLRMSTKSDNIFINRMLWKLFPVMNFFLNVVYNFSTYFKQEKQK